MLLLYYTMYGIEINYGRMVYLWRIMLPAADAINSGFMRNNKICMPAEDCSAGNCI